LSGKTEVAKIMANKLGYHVVDMRAIEGTVKAKMGSEEEPFEGEVPI